MSLSRKSVMIFGDENDDDIAGILFKLLVRMPSKLDRLTFHHALFDVNGQDCFVTKDAGAFTGLARDD